MASFFFIAALAVELLAQSPSPQAFLRFEPDGQPYVEVVGQFEAARLTVFEGANVLGTAALVSPPYQVRLRTVPTKGLTVVVSPDGAAAPPQLLTVDQEITLQLTPVRDCSGLGIVAELAGDSDYAADRLRQLFQAAAALKRRDVVVRVETAARDGAFGLGLTGEPRVIPSTADRAVADGGFVACLPVSPLPAGQQDVEVRLLSVPSELAGPFLKTDLSGGTGPASVTVFPSKDETPGGRSVDKNLDLGVLGTSSLGAPDADGIRRRITRQIVDVRFAPILNWRPGLGSLGSTRTLHYLTPFMVDAKISSGELTKETAATNTVVLGGEYELRHFSSTNRYPTYHRFVARASHASDRSFERAEMKVAAEWRPVFAALNQPKGTMDSVSQRDLDPSPQRAAKILTTDRGFEILPVAGLETGHTYRWENAPAGVERKTDFVRGYFGVSATLDPLNWLRVRFANTLYLRSETPDDRLRSYLTLSVELPIAPVLSQGAQSVFLGYEKGSLPPFEKAEVDTVRIGYRIQLTGWFARYR